MAMVWWWVVLAAVVAARLALAIKMHLDRRRRRTLKTMVVLGSGGHTAEMLALLGGMDLTTYAPRHYVVASTDGMSPGKAAAFEQMAGDRPAGMPPPPSPCAEVPGRQRAVRRSPRKQLRQPPASPRSAVRSASASKRQQRGWGSPGAPPHHASSPPPLSYTLTSIPRSREVGQSFRSSVRPTLSALWHCLRLVFTTRPDVLLTNGPGTALPLCAAAVLARLLGLAGCHVVYVESIARVYRLSLTGKILYRLRLADAFFVQWEELAAAHPRALFAGRLM